MATAISYENYKPLKLPAITKPTLSSKFTAGTEVYGIAADSKRQRLIVRRQDESLPITLYDYDGNLIQVLGRDVTDIASKDNQGISIDTKRDLLVFPIVKDIIQMNMTGSVVNSGTIPCDFKVHHVEHCKENDLYCVSAFETPRISIVNPDTLQVIKSFHREDFSQPFSLTCTLIDAQPCMIFCNNANSQLNVIDFQGQERFTIGPDLAVGRLCWPYDVITDPAGQIVICDTDNKRVVSACIEKGEVKSEVLIDSEQLSNLKEVSFLSYDPCEKKLFAASYFGSIFVFQSE